MSESKKTIGAFVILSAAALIAYFGVLPHIIPGQQIASGITKSEILDQSTETLLTHGYDVSELMSRSALTSDRRAVADFVHTRGRPELNERLRSPDQLIPPFYSWELKWSGTDQLQASETNISITITTDPKSREELNKADVETHFSPYGHLLSLNLSDVPEPTGLNPEVFSHLYQGPDTDITLFLEDHEPELITALIDSTTNAETRVEENRLIIGRSDLIQAGSKIIENTYWERFDLEVDSISVDNNNSNTYHSNVSLHFVTPDAVYGYMYEVRLDLTSGGFPTELSYEFEKTEPFEKAFADYLEFYSGIGPVLIVLIVLILFFIRLNNRLISPRIVFTDAIIFGLILLLLAASNLLAISTDLQFTPQVFAVSAGVILLAAFAALAFIPFGATTESWSHESFPEKMYTLTLLRNGFLINPQVGRALLNGISGGFAFLLLVTLLLLLDSHSLYRFDQELPTGILLFDFLSGLTQIGNGMIRAMFFTFFVIAPMSFFILAKIKNIYFGIALIILITLLVGGLVPESNHTLIDLGFRALSAAGLTYLILRFDVITLLTAIFSATLILNSKMEILTPDLNLPSALLIAGSLLIPAVIGLIGLRTNTDDQHLPDLRPEYLKKLAEEERILQGHKLAREVHQSFLPQSLPQFEELDLAARCTPAQEVGGDYYDFFKLTDNRLAVVVGDVSGKGIHAAFYMTLIKGYLQSLADDPLTPKELVTKTHRLFLENSRPGTFVTMIYGIIDLKADTFTFVRAGHNPLIHLQTHSENPIFHRPDGLAIGMGTPEQFERNLQEVTLPLYSGDVLLLYTDGCTESKNVHDEILGEEAFLNMSKKYSKHSASQMIEHLSEEIHRFSGNRKINDDLTLVAIRKR